MNDRSDAPTEFIDFGIATALDIERRAVCAALGLSDSQRVKRGSRVYWKGTLSLKDGSFYEIVVAQASDMANVDAALLASDMIHEWQPGALLFAGIAGTVKDEVALGDLVLGSSIYYYERGKMTTMGLKPEPIMYKADATLWANATALPPWNEPIACSRPDHTDQRPKIHYGVIASGEKVIAEEAARDQISAGHRKILAIEMEGYGFSAAVWQSFGHHRHLVIRAICDKADRTKDENWQLYASAVAGGFVRHFLLDSPLPALNKKKPSLSALISQVKVPNLSNKAAAFLSYVHFDDDLDQGQITKFGKRLSQEVQRHTGEEFHIFQDRNDNEWKKNWIDRIEEFRATSTFLIPIITPSFFNSDFWLHDLEIFLRYEIELNRDDLVFPIYYVDCPFFNRENVGTTKRDALIRTLALRKPRDWRELRFKTSTSVTLLRAIAQLAIDIRDVLERTKQPPVQHPDVSALSKTHEAQSQEHHEQSRPAIRSNQSLISRSSGLTRPYRILHIADPHFSNCHFVGDPAQVGQRHAEELEQHLQQHHLIPELFDAMVLSGDFTFACRRDGFIAAEVFIKALSHLIRTNGIVIVPGDHDIDIDIGSEPKRINRFQKPLLCNPEV